MHKSACMETKQTASPLHCGGRKEGMERGTEAAREGRRKEKGEGGRGRKESGSHTEVSKRRGAERKGGRQEGRESGMLHICCICAACMMHICCILDA